MAFTLHSQATIRETLQQAVLFLNGCGIEDARLAAEWLLSHDLGCARLELSLRRDDLLPPETCQTLHAQINRLAAGEPLQYVLGQTDFYGHVFKVDRRCLIPRPETELLVDWVAGLAPLWAIHQPSIVDVGTGSGCIVISLALARPEARYEAVDASADALALAKDNALTHGVLDRIGFSTRHLLTDIPPGTLDAVISNPPYVRAADWERLPRQVRGYEPRSALDGGPDGLSVIRPLIAQAARALKPGGRLFMEIGEDQWPEIQVFLDRAGFRDKQVRQDFAGKHRMIMAQT